MKRFQMLVVAVFAVFAFGVVAASSAMAEEETTRCVAKTEGLWELQSSTFGLCEVNLSSANSPFELVVFLLAEWLFKSEAVTATLSVETTGELLLEDKKATLGVKAMVLCSGVQDGTIGANGVGEITQMLSLTGTAISTSVLSGTGLLCSGQEGCTTGTENAEIWATGLPWKTLLELVEEASPTAYAGFVILILPNTAGGHVGWYTLCATALGTSEDECLAEEGAAEASNLTGGINGEFSEAFTRLVAKLANCSASSEKETANIEGLGEEKVAGSSEVLSVSSTG